MWLCPCARRGSLRIIRLLRATRTKKVTTVQNRGWDWLHTWRCCLSEAGYIPNRANAGRLKTKESILSQVSELQVQTEKRFHFSKQHVIDALIENAGKALGRRPIGGGDAHYYVGKDPDVRDLHVGAIGLNTRMQNSWWYQGGGEQLGNEFFKKYGVIAHAGGNPGTQMGGWFRKEIKTTADLAGLKFRIAGIAGQIFQKVGAVPQQLAATMSTPRSRRARSMPPNGSALTMMKSSVCRKSPNSTITPASGRPVRCSIL